MSSELRRQLREALGPEIKGLQRAVALEIADDARYDDAWGFDAAKGRRSKVRLGDLVRWTGAKDELSVREMLRRLAVAGWEFRLPIGEGRDGRDGRPLYAIPGVAMQFRVPDFEGPTVVGPSSSKGPTVVGEGPTTVGEGPTVVAEGPTVVGPPSPVLLLASPKDSPSSSAEVVVPELAVAAATEGGGGGFSPSEQNSEAEPLVAALDFRGRPPGARQRAQLITLVAAALDGGWSAQDLKAYLDLGGAAVNSAAAVYVHRLGAGELPDAQTFREAQDRPLAGTDAAVAGWMGLAASLPGGVPQRRGYRPSDPNAVWERYDADARADRAPSGAETIPHCGDPDCDEITRTREAEAWNGLKTLQMCTGCHPAMRF